MHPQTMPPDAALRRGTCVLAALPQTAALVAAIKTWSTGAAMSSMTIISSLLPGCSTEG